jgi:hypothetical protein
MCIVVPYLGATHELLTLANAVLVRKVPLLDLQKLTAGLPDLGGRPPRLGPVVTVGEPSGRYLTSASRVGCC